MNEDLIKKLNDNTDFTSFKEWLVTEINNLDSVDGLDALPNIEAGEEAKIRSKTKAKLMEILAPFMNVREEKERSAADVNKAKKRYGV